MDTNPRFWWLAPLGLFGLPILVAAIGEGHLQQDTLICAVFMSAVLGLAVGGTLAETLK